MNKEQQGDLEEGLNLGLSDLLSASKETTRDEELTSEVNFVLVSEGDPPTSGDISNATESKGSDQEVSVDPFRKLADDSDWVKLNLLCEQQLVKEPENTAVKIWWLKAQLELDSVPLTILAAPIESAYEDFGKKSEDKSENEKLLELSPLLSEILRRCGENLCNNEEKEIGLEFLRRSADLNPESVESFCKSVEEEIENLSAVTGRAHKQKNKEKISNLKSLLSQYQTRQPEARTQESEAKESRSDSAVITDTRPAPRRSSLTFFYLWMRPHSRAIAGLSLILLLAVVLYAQLTSKPASTQLARLSLEPPSTIALMEVPELEAVTTLSNLGAMFYDIENGAPSPSPAGQVARAPVARAPAPQPGPSDGALVSPPAPRQPQSREPQRGEVNTSYPPEPEELRQASRSNHTEMLEGYHVQPFSTETHYIVTARTVIRSRPSHFGIAVGDLERGDRVLAEARVGPWIRLRSYSGAPGYIMAENAERLS